RMFEATLIEVPTERPLANYLKAGVPILNQGNEGACTGFGLATVVHYLLRTRKVVPDRGEVSPRMLYEMARRYDEWPGEKYEGSSARGAMKGWIAHGVCTSKSWTPTMKGPGHLSPKISEEASGTPGGAYYRVTHTNVRDMHAALNEVGILYATLMVHSGWDAENLTRTVPINYVESGNVRSRKLPLIERKGSADDGHAVAIVG